MQQTPKILIIYTGGTIGMIKDPNTGALRAFNFDNLLVNIPEINLLDCQLETVAIENPIDSSDMNPTYWSEIVSIIASNYNTNDGFVVLHGSDTMSYTASALSFMLENLIKPVIITGSQLPIGDLRTDAKENLITAIQIASAQKNGKPIVREVGLYFEYKLYRGNRTTKLNAEHFEAFDSPNYPPLAESGVHLKYDFEHLLKSEESELIVHKELNTNIAILKIFPGIRSEVVEAILDIPSLQGVVLETYGAGNATTEVWFIDLLKRAIDNGVHIVNVTQCAGGSVILGQYATSTTLKEIGIISGHDMTTEAALTKLMYLLSLDLPSEEFKQNFETSLRGEVTN
ncbi:MAG: asparaginase [bacterium]